MFVKRKIKNIVHERSIQDSSIFSDLRTEGNIDNNNNS